jgi:hypothetical protein
MNGDSTARGRGRSDARSATPAAAPSQQRHLADARSALAHGVPELEVLEPVVAPSRDYFDDFVPGTVPPDYWVD